MVREDSKGLAADSHVIAKPTLVQALTERGTKKKSLTATKILQSIHCTYSIIVHISYC